MAQLNSPPDLNLVIMAPSREVFQRCLSRLPASVLQNVIWCDASRETRTDVINRHPRRWLCFLDHDCVVSPAQMAGLRSLISAEKQKFMVYAGRYDSPPQASYLQKFHNFVANTWLEHSYHAGSGQPLLLGGIFMVYHDGVHLPAVTERFWGGEDKLLAYEMKAAGFSFALAPQLRVCHETSRDWRHFFRRSYLHGVNEVKFVGKREAVSYRFWICKIGFANLNLLPLIVLHFCIQRAAALFQRVRRWNR